MPKDNAYYKAEEKIKAALHSRATNRPHSVYHSLRSGTTSPKYDNEVHTIFISMLYVVFGEMSEGQRGQGQEVTMPKDEAYKQAEQKIQQALQSRATKLDLNNKTRPLQDSLTNHQDVFITIS